MDLTILKPDNMNIGNHLQKEFWTRRVPVDSNFRTTTHGVGYKQRISAGAGYATVNLTQDDFLNEIESSAHSINSQYSSRRPVYAPTGVKDKNGKEEWKIDHYDDIETVSLGLQHCISMKKASHFASEGFWISMEEGKEESFARLLSWKDRIDINTAFMEVVKSCFCTGDGAIYLYQKGNTIDYKVFSYQKGDKLYPDEDENGNEILFRQYKYKGIDAVDIFTTESVQTWMNIPEDTSFMGKITDAIKKANNTKSEDGYTLVKETPSQLRGELPVVYFRIPDIPSGPAQLSIEALENALSYNAEEVKSSAFPILFLKSEKIATLPPSDLNGKTIGVKGTAENLAHADAKFLTPPDSSNISSTHIDSLQSNIIKTTMSVFIEPEIFKSGLDSSAALKLLFTPEIQWAQNMWPYFNKGVRSIAEILKTLVGKVEGNLTEYADLKISVGQNIYIPQNEKEKVDMETSQVYARIKSRKAAMADLGNSHVGDYEQIEKEWEKELTIKSEIPAKYKDTPSTQTEENPDAPKIDKNDKGRTIAER